MKKILVHLHLYYHEQLDFMLDKLTNIKNCEWDLYVTTCEYIPEANFKIIEFKEDAKIIQLKNVGYDVYPFIHVLGILNLDDYDYIIKIHTKKPLKYENYPCLRSILISSILGSYDVFQNNLNLLEQNKNIGMIGCANLLFDIEDESVENIPVTNTLLKRLAITKREGAFIAGTMFMVRAHLMNKIKELNLQLEEFKYNCQNKTLDSGTLAHAMESVLGVVVLDQGYAIAGVPYLESDAYIF